jgi:hypothetical protein
MMHDVTKTTKDLLIQSAVIVTAMALVTLGITLAVKEHYDCYNNAQCRAKTESDRAKSLNYRSKCMAEHAAAHGMAIAACNTLPNFRDWFVCRWNAASEPPC